MPCTHHSSVLPAHLHFAPASGRRRSTVLRLPIPIAHATDTTCSTKCSDRRRGGRNAPAQITPIKEHRRRRPHRDPIAPGPKLLPLHTCACACACACTRAERAQHGMPLTAGSASRSLLRPSLLCCRLSRHRRPPRHGLNGYRAWASSFAAREQAPPCCALR